MRRTKFQFLLIILFGVGLAVLLGTAGSAYVPPLTQASGATTPFTSGCNGAPQTGTNYPDAEVEPWVAVNPSNPKNIIGVWQQDRWSNGGANGLATGVSHNGGQTWSQTAAHFTRCSGGSASNGGDYERASDPWVTFSPNGTAHQIALVLNDSNPINGVTVSRSTDGGDNWSEPITLIRDTDPNFVDDKESITADPYNSNLVYAVWDRLDLRTEPDGNRGPALLAKTTNGGQSWNSPQTIYDPGYNGETIGNQIVVLPNGDLVDLFALFTGQPANTESPAAGPSYIAIVRSTDKGQTWSQQPIMISTLQSVGVTDPQTGEALRTGSIIPDIAVDQRTGYLYVVWEDAKFSGGKRDGIVFSKSTDGGFTWSAPVQVNRFPQVPAFTAAVDVAIDGAIGLTYYDLRNDTADPKTLPTNYWFALSYDGGTTWRESHVAGPFDMRTAPVTSTGFFVGDYEGLIHIFASFTPFFVQTNSNTSNPTDVFYTQESGGEVVYTANSTVNSSGSSNGSAAAVGAD